MQAENGVSLRIKPGGSRTIATLADKGAFGDMYDHLCQYSHPNWHGTNLGCSIEGTTKLFADPTKVFDLDSKPIVTALELSVILYIQTHLRCLSLLEKHEKMPEFERGLTRT